jgi:hypothetical protein
MQQPYRPKQADLTGKQVCCKIIIVSCSRRRLSRAKTWGDNPRTGRGRLLSHGFTRGIPPWERYSAGGPNDGPRNETERNVE